jgi:hypothetical protein
MYKTTMPMGHGEEITKENPIGHQHKHFSGGIPDTTFACYSRDSASSIDKKKHTMASLKNTTKSITKNRE